MKSKNKVTIVLLTFLLIVVTAQSVLSLQYYVSSSGSDSNTGSQSAPFKTIQKGLNVAQPGDTINLIAGEYRENIRSVRSGSQDNPITIKGNSEAILRTGGSGNRIFEINHHYIHLNGFTVDGLIKEGDTADDYADKLVYVQGVNSEGIKGLKILNMKFKNSGGEAVRLRYFIRNAEVAYSSFENIGVYDFKFNGGGKNGEAIYLGTSSNQWADGKNPTADPDVSANNRIHHNYFNTQGNECVDIKEGSVNNTVEYNTCTGQKDPNSAGLDSRSDENIFRHNKVFGNDGAGVRLGGHLVNGIQYGKNNDVYNNTLYSNKAGGVKFQTTPQRNICGNTMYSNSAGNSVGTYGSQFDPAKTCGENIVVNPVIDTPVVTVNNTIENNTTITTPNSTINPPVSEFSLLPISKVTASSNDGNVPENTVDNSLETRWSAKGKGQWVTYQLSEQKRVREIMMAFYKGDSRVQYFRVYTSMDGKKWTRAYSGKSAGNTTDYQTFNLRDADSRYVKIIGDGTNENTWNSLTEVKILGS